VVEFGSFTPVVSIISIAIQYDIVMKKLSRYDKGGEVSNFYDLVSGE